MWSFIDLLHNFFTHKDFLPSADKLPGTMFTPLHVIFSLACILLVAIGCYTVSRKDKKTIKTVFAVLWGILVVLEITKIVWESCSGNTVGIEWTGVLPLYPCSIFMYSMPFAIWGHGHVRNAACGYVCTLGLLGGAINFVYPANILSNYSCISFAGFHTFLYHGTIVFCALTMLISRYHSYAFAQKRWEVLLPSVPFLAVSVVANLVNFSPIRSDYMFFKLESFIFAPIGAATPDWLAVILVYVAYLAIHTLPYLAFYLYKPKQ